MSHHADSTFVSLVRQLTLRWSCLCHTSRPPACYTIVLLLCSSACQRPSSPTLTTDRPTSSPARERSTNESAAIERATEDNSLATLPALNSRLELQRQAKQDAALDPHRDGWTSEAFSEEAQRIVEQLAQYAYGIQAPTIDLLQPIIHADFVASSLRPPSMATIFDDGVVSIDRPSQALVAGAASFQGVDGCLRAGIELSGGLESYRDRHVHTKTIRVRGTPQGAATEHLIEFAAHRDTQHVEQHARWQCEWRKVAGTTQLSSVQLIDFESASSKSPLFADETEHVVGSDQAYRHQLQLGLNHWLQRIEITHGIYIFAEYGLAVGDVNGDGRDDIYVCQPAGLPNRLLVTQPDGRRVDVSAEAGVDWLDHTSSALFVDIDNDGDQDLALAVESKKVLFLENDRHGHFTLAAEVALADRHVQGLSAADFDNDGKIDLYLTIGFADETARTSEQRPAFLYHDANEGGANVLLHNECKPGAWTFRDVTRTVGLDEHNRRHSLAAAWEDFDNDGDQDLYVANDYGQNCLYQNDQGRFHDVAEELALVDFGSGMSVSWSDYDHNGHVDLYVGNMFSSAGNRITRQAAFQRHVATEARSILPRFAKGNSLFRNLGHRKFEDAGAEAGIEFGRWAWSSLFCDINNDGWDDVVIANGYITGDDRRDL